MQQDELISREERSLGSGSSEAAHLPAVSVGQGGSEVLTQPGGISSMGWGSASATLFLWLPKDGLRRERVSPCHSGCPQICWRTCKEQVVPSSVQGVGQERGAGGLRRGSCKRRNPLLLVCWGPPTCISSLGSAGAGAAWILSRNQVLTGPSFGLLQGSMAPLTSDSSSQQLHCPPLFLLFPVSGSPPTLCPSNPGSRPQAQERSP